MFNLYHLKFFYDAVKLGSLTASANVNFLSRPGVSQGIKSLEKQLGVGLMTHKKREFQLTPQGTWLYGQCQSLFENVGRIENQIIGRAGKPIGPIRVGSSRSLAKLILPKLLVGLEKKYPELSPSFVLGTSKEISVAIENKTIDVGLMIIDHLPVPGSYLKFIEGYFVCVESVKNRFKNRLIITEDRFETHALKNIPKISKMPEVSYLQIQSWDLIFDLVSQGLGMGLIPDFMLKFTASNKLRVVPGLGKIAKYYGVAAYQKEDVNTSALPSVLQPLGGKKSPVVSLT